MPIVHARDAAQAKIAAIGSVNPRAGGPLNALIQFVKKTIARSLQWFVRDQVTFNRETVSALEGIMEALNDHNRALFAGRGRSANRELVADVRDSERSAAALDCSGASNGSASSLRMRRSFCATWPICSAHSSIAPR